MEAKHKTGPRLEVHVVELSDGKYCGFIDLVDCGIGDHWSRERSCAHEHSRKDLAEACINRIAAKIERAKRE